MSLPILYRKGTGVEVPPARQNGETAETPGWRCPISIGRTPFIATDRKDKVMGDKEPIGMPGGIALQESPCPGRLSPLTTTQRDCIVQHHTGLRVRIEQVNEGSCPDAVTEYGDRSHKAPGPQPFNCPPEVSTIQGRLASIELEAATPGHDPDGGL
jgi:hypothetical protein